jgi:hypothetical protein
MTQPSLNEIAAASALLARAGFIVVPPATPASAPLMLPAHLVAGMSFQAVMADAARHSQMEDQELAEAIGLSGGYMSRFLRGTGDQWARRLVIFMNTTNSRGPLQWLASRVECDVIDRKAA